MKKQKIGKITTEYGAFPEPHELATAKVFARLGYDVLFLGKRVIRTHIVPNLQA